MLRKPFLLFLVIQFVIFNIQSVISPLSAQNKTIDSLRILLEKNKKDTCQVNYLNKLSSEYVNLSSYDTSLHYANSALQLAQYLEFKHGIAQAYNSMGAIYWYQGDYPKALDYYSNGLKMEEEIGNKNGVAKNFGNIGNVYLTQGDYSKALDYYFKALKIGEELGDKNRIAIQLGNIGMVYMDQADYPKALDYFLKALKFGKEVGDKKRELIVLGNIGTVYGNQGSYSKALDYYFEALKMTEELGNKKLQANSLSDIGSLYYKQKIYAKALDYTLKALKMDEVIGEKYGIANSSINIGNIYKDKLSYTEAGEWLQRGLLLSKDIGAKELEMESYKGLSETFEKAGDYKNAYKYRQFYSQIKDSIFNLESNKHIAELQTKYETTQKDNRIKILEKQSIINNLEIKEQNLNIQKRNYLLIAVLLLFLMLAAGIYFWFSRQRLKNQMVKEKIIKETEENERLRMAKDIHDDLGSGLSKINFLSEIVYQKSEQFPEIRNNSESIKETTRKIIENMHDLIWTLNPENTTLANLIARMREYAADYLEDFPIELKSSFPDNIPPTFITKESHRGLFMVVKESLNNISKHSKATEVFFNVTLASETLLLVIQDNGIGFNTETASKGNGLRNMQSRITALGGLFDLTSNNSAKNTLINISVPLKKILKL